MNNIDFDQLSSVLSTSGDLARLKNLSGLSDEIRIAVFGTYNHGKSTLLNSLVGKEVFKCSDKRETVKNKSFLNEGVIWVDTPGLNADVEGRDDIEARKGAFEIADFLFLVHNINSGELDRYELDFYNEVVLKKGVDKCFLILTQIDNHSNGLELEKVERAIRNQMPMVGLKMFSVSAKRYLRGVNENKKVFVEKSGINNVKGVIDICKRKGAHHRVCEVRDLKSKIHGSLLKIIEKKKFDLSSIKDSVLQKKSAFSRDISNVFLP